MTTSTHGMPIACQALSERNALKGKDMDQILEEATKLLPSSLSELEEAKPATRKLPTKVAPQAPPAPPPPTPPPPPPAPTARSGATPTAAPAAAFSASVAPARTPHSAAKAKPAPKMMPRSKPETQKRVKLEDPGPGRVTVYFDLCFLFFGSVDASFGLVKHHQIQHSRS